MRKILPKFRLSSTTSTCFISTACNVHKYIDFHKNVVYGGDLPSATHNQSVGSLLFSRMLRPDRREEVLQMCAWTQKEITTKMFLEKTVAVAEKLAEKGTKKGDFVLLVGNNSLNMNISMIGALLLAAVPVPLSYKTELEEFHVILNSIKPRYFGCEGKYLHLFRKILVYDTDFDPSKIFLLNEERDPAEPGVEGFKDFTRGRGLNYESFQPTEVSDPKSELALAMKALTDGAPGRVVGVTHHNLNSVIARYEAADGVASIRKEVILMAQKVLWMSGVYSLILSCAFGSKLVIMRKFDEELFLKYIHDYAVTRTYMFGSKWWLLYKHTPKAQYDLSSCKQAIAVDGSLPKILTEGLKEKIGLTLSPCFGVTELTGLALKQVEGLKKEGCVGKLVPQVYGKVQTESKHRNAGPKIPGELCFKGPIVTLGYINNRKENQNAFDKEGYFLSGIYGYFDESGDFFIIDTIIHQINYRDYKISPKELEGIIRSLDRVKDVCVSGIKHDTDGEYPIAFVVLQRGQKLSEEEIINYINGKVPDHKRLRGGVVFLPKIPRHRETGHINRKLLKNVLSKYRIKMNAPDKEEDLTKLNYKRYNCNFQITHV